MKWKDFLYFRSGSKIGVTLLLILIVLSLILNILLSYRNSSPIVVMQNDSIVREFDAFLQTLKTADSLPSIATSEPGSGRQAPRERSSSGRQSPYENSPRGDHRPSEFPRYPRVEKLAEGETISLNNADTAEWKRIPGIGSVYAERIVEHRDRLGGFVRKEQLMEVYGVDSEMYGRISPYIEQDGGWKKVLVNKLKFKELLRHPYLSYKQVQAIVNLRDRKGNITSIRELAMLDEFTSEDIYRLEPYLEF